MMQIAANLTSEPQKTEESEKVPSLKWEKCSEERKNAYNGRLAQLLDAKPGVLTSCSEAHCQKNDCSASIQKEFDSLTEIITEADKVLPRHRPGVKSTGGRIN